jgi:hypothetical protein
MLYNFDANGKENWVIHVKNILYKYGFGIAFLSKNVGNVVCFLSEFKLLQWLNNIHSLTKLKIYGCFKGLPNVEKYLSVVKLRQHKTALTRFRCSNQCLE